MTRANWDKIHHAVVIHVKNGYQLNTHGEQILAPQRGNAGLHYLVGEETRARPEKVPKKQGIYYIFQLSTTTSGVFFYKTLWSRASNSRLRSTPREGPW